MSNVVARADRRRSLAGALGILGAAVTLSGCGAGGFGADQPPSADRTISSYVALGDGFTAAPYTGETVGDDGCLRSDVNYPALVAEELELSDVEDVSCTGAPASALTGDFKPGKDEDPLPPQLDAIDEDTDLVTLGAGIEDRDVLRQAFRVCVAAPCTDKVLPTTILQDLKATTDSLTAAVRRIQDRAPQAYIVLVGYPKFTPDVGSCDALPQLEQPSMDAASYVFDTLNREIESAARETGAGYLDVAELTTGHELCTEDPWVEGMRGQRGRSVAYHPVAAEQRAVAEALATMVRSR